MTASNRWKIENVRRVRRALTLAFAATCFLGCKQSSKDGGLPPPSGSGMPPPTLPAVASSAEGAAPIAIAGSEDGVYRGTGTVRAREKAELGPKSSGVITAITVDEGDRVKKGKLLFRLDAQQAGLAVSQARASLETANVALSSAELELKRTKELFDRGSVAPATFDQAKTRYDSAKSGVRQAEVAVSQARSAAGDTAVYAPFSGVVTAKHKSVGEIATMTPPTVVLVLQDVDVLELRSRMPERALRDLAPDEPIEIEFPALQEKRTARINRINPTIDILTRTVEIVAEIDNADGRLKPGMLAQVTFGSSSKRSAEPAPSASSASGAKAP